MFQLPFYVRSVEQGIVSGFGGALVFFTIVFLADRRWLGVRAAVDWVLSWRFRAFEESRRYPIFRRLLLGLATFLAVMGLAYTLLATGVVRNGDPPPLPTLEEFRQEFEKRRRSR